MRILATAVLAAFGAAAAAGDGAAAEPLLNPSFEEPGEFPSSWIVSNGAKTANEGTASDVAVSRAVASDGKASLRLSGDAKTAYWRMAQQELPATPGDWVDLRVKACAKGLVFEGASFRNANATLEFVDAKGERLALLGSEVLPADCDWRELAISAMAPEGAARMKVGLFLSVPGTVWFDDVRVTAVPAEVDTPEGRARVVARLRAHFVATYPFFGVAGRPTADAWFAKREKSLLDAKDRDAFFDALQAALSDLDDLHVNLVTPGATHGTKRTSSEDPANRRNWNLASVTAALTDTVAQQRELIAGRVGRGADAIGYVAIGKWQWDGTSFAAVEKALDALSDTKALIVDVRMNGGGDEAWATKVASRFTASDVVFGRVRYRDPSKPQDTTAFLPSVDRVLRAHAPRKADTRPVVVLQGPGCVSSNEAFVAMMSTFPNVTTVGLTTRGATANPAPYPLLLDLSVLVPRWQALDLAGELIEGRGIAPDVLVESPARGHADADPTFARALELLRK